MSSSMHSFEGSTGAEGAAAKVAQKQQVFANC